MRLTKKGTVATAAVLALALGGGVAYAYWTTTGTGTATATTATDVNLVVAQVGTVSGLYPNGPAQGISFTITNPNLNAETVANTVVAVTGTSNAGCTAADFALTQPTFAGSIAGSGGVVTVSNGDIQMIDTGSNQNACKGVTVDLSIDVS